MNNLWVGLSQRERRLAVITVALLLVFLVVFATGRARTTIRLLDHQIDNAEQTLENLKQLEARGKSVEDAYAKVAAEHSSAWNKAEIANRLRMEIYHQAMADPAAPLGSSGNLFEIPSLNEGTLKENPDRDYREYQLSINIPMADMSSLIEFVARLQRSPQALRVDGLEISRPPEAPYLGAVVDVTRIVCAGPTATRKSEENPKSSSVTPAPAAAAAPQQSASAPTDWKGTDLNAWKGEGSKILSGTSMPQGAPGGSCLRAESEKPNATVFMPQVLVPGKKYTLAMDMAATGKTVLELSPDDTKQAQTQTVDVTSDGKVYRYEVTFEAPSSNDKLLPFRAPALRLLEAGTSVYVDNVTLQPVAE